MHNELMCFCQKIWQFFGFWWKAFATVEIFQQLLESQREFFCGQLLKRIFLGDTPMPAVNFLWCDCQTDEVRSITHGRFDEGLPMPITCSDLRRETVSPSSAFKLKSQTLSSGSMFSHFQRLSRTPSQNLAIPLIVDSSLQMIPSQKDLASRQSSQLHSHPNAFATSLKLSKRFEAPASSMSMMLLCSPVHRFLLHLLPKTRSKEGKS